MSSLYRLFVISDLKDHLSVEVSKEQQHYLLNVLRLKTGDSLLLFNGRDGEWRTEIEVISRRKCVLTAKEQTRKQVREGGQQEPDIHYLFAPIKRGRLDYMVQKATELGVSHIQPVLTDYTNIGRIKQSRMEANIVEAAEQCGILHLPTLAEPASLEKILKGWDCDRKLIFCDEAAPLSSPLESLGLLKRHSPLAVLIGPEGGFSPKESALLRGMDYVVPISLGPRIMRADTAAVAALALVNACLADWV